MGKYDELSGKGKYLTTTPFGLLTEIILQTNVVIYLNKNTRCYSLDKWSWEELNLGLFKQLLELRECGCENIKIVTTNTEALENE